MSDHPITIEPVPGRVSVRFNGAVVVDTDKALVMHESIYPPVYYLPLSDTVTDALKPSDHSTHCPHKGDASYFTLSVDGSEAENAVWIYREPKDGVAQIRDHIAFYPKYVQIEVAGG